eukprot:scaffold94115_cov39-Tisochrysis_lutea.AAC.1
MQACSYARPKRGARREHGGHTCKSPGTKEGRGVCAAREARLATDTDTRPHAGVGEGEFCCSSPTRGPGGRSLCSGQTCAAAAPPCHVLPPLRYRVPSADENRQETATVEERSGAGSAGIP